MIKLKSELNKKEKTEVKMILGEITDIYGDFYITRNNLRLFIKENIDLLYECLKKGDKIAFGEEDGILFVTGWSDNANRKYIKILAQDENSADRLLKILSWDVDCELYIKIKKNNPIINILKKNNFEFLGDRGREILYVKKGSHKISKKEEKKK